MSHFAYILPHILPMQNVELSPVLTLMYILYEFTIFIEYLVREPERNVQGVVGLAPTKIAFQNRYAHVACNLCYNVLIHFSYSRLHLQTEILPSMLV